MLGMYNGTSILENPLEVLQKLSTRVPCDLAFAFVGFYVREREEKHVDKESCPRIFMAA